MTQAIDPKLDRRCPTIAAIERRARRRMPRFVWDHLAGGVGEGGGLSHNRESLKAVRLVPRYLEGADQVDTTARFLGHSYAAPIGVAPVGLGGLAWPKSPELLAEAAHAQEIPFIASTFALASLETLRENAGSYGWFQLYHLKDQGITDDLVNRAQAAGYDVLVVTVDVPAPTRRAHDIGNGFAVPFRLGPKMVLDVLSRPRWAMALRRYGLPRFENLARYVPDHLDRNGRITFLEEMTNIHVTPAMLEHLRTAWPGKLVVKGLLHPEEVVLCRDVGVDAVVVSNHGGRQLEAAPSAVDVLPGIRRAVGDDFPLIADGGVRSGTDICRMLAKGADFVLAGRPFYAAVAALGPEGADHVMTLLKAELEIAMGQLGRRTVDALRVRMA